MSDVDQFRLRGADDEDAAAEPNLERQVEVPTRDEEKSPVAWIAVVLVVVVLALVGAGVWWWSRRGEEPAPPPPPAAESPAAAEAPAAEPPFVLPSLDQSDAVVRELVAKLSSHPQLARWLVTDDLVRRTAKVVGNIAWGEDPRPHVPFLKLAEPFRVEQGSAVTIDPRSYERYDLAADVFTSIDTPGAVALYRRFRPLLREAYAELGYPDDWDTALRTAVRTVLETPAVPADAQLVPASRAYRYVDPALEALTPAQKLLLRSGPENARRIEAKVRELATAAGVLR